MFGVKTLVNPVSWTLPSTHSTCVNRAGSKAAGVDNDLVSTGLGIRAKRFAAVVENGVVKHIAYEPPGGKITVTGAEAVLAAL